MNQIASRILDNSNKLALLSELADSGTSEEISLSLGARIGLGTILMEMSLDLNDILSEVDDLEKNSIIPGGEKEGAE